MEEGEKEGKEEEEYVYESTRTVARIILKYEAGICVKRDNNNNNNDDDDGGGGGGGGCEGGGREDTSEFNALVILNAAMPKYAVWLWQLCKMRVCADGGANRLFDEVKRTKEDLMDDNEYSRNSNDLLQLQKKDMLNLYIPHTIVGDMDSIRDDVS